MAQAWLDAARYADTNGYHIDNHRDIWKYREWVIGAFNKNLPFDRFTVEQLAGDLLPEPSVDQRIASGFNRNAMVNFEGGADPEEYLTKYIGDRVTTTSTVFLGVTMACAECHDHKYDPFTQRDFYRFYAFFNGISEQGLDGQKESPAPRMKVPTSEQTARLAEIKAKSAQVKTKLDAASDRAQLVPSSIGSGSAASSRPTGRSSRTLRSSLLANGSMNALSKQPRTNPCWRPGANPDKDVYEFVATTNLARITAIRLEALTHETFARKSTGRADNGNFGPDRRRGRGRASSRLPTSSSPSRWRGPWPTTSRPTATSGSRRRSTPTPRPAGPSTAIRSARIAGYDLPAPGAVRRQGELADQGPAPVREHLRPPCHRPIPTVGHQRRAAHAREPLPSKIAGILATRPSLRSEEPQLEGDPGLLPRRGLAREGRAIRGELDGLKATETEAEKSIAVTMVMAEMPKPRSTHILMRGDFRSKGPTVEAGVPEEPAAAPDRPARQTAWAWPDGWSPPATRSSRG